jgi:protein SCO1/2
LFERKIEWLAWGALLVTFLALLAVLGLRRSRPGPLPFYGALPEFTLTNQDNQAVTLESLRGNIWIADVIFTRCAGQCPVMSAHIKDIQDALPRESGVKLVSFTTDPEFDTPQVLKNYGIRLGAREGQWIFLTGRKAELRRATVEGMKLSVLDKAPGQREDAADLFIHSDKFVLIDRSGRIRGYFDGQTAAGVAQAEAAARALARQ